MMSFQCEKIIVPAEICIRVTLRNGLWTEAQGTLPERPGGASGPGSFSTLQCYGVSVRCNYETDMNMRYQLQLPV